jgi:hypothetical protein
VRAAESWRAAKDTTSIEVLEAFIARYKDTFFAALARARVDELKRIVAEEERQFAAEAARKKAEAARQVAAAEAAKRKPTKRPWPSASKRNGSKNASAAKPSSHLLVRAGLW